MPESRDLVDRLKDWTGRTAVPDALLNEAATLIEDLEKRVEEVEKQLEAEQKVAQHLEAENGLVASVRAVKAEARAERAEEALRQIAKFPDDQFVYAYQLRNIARTALNHPSEETG